MTKDVLHASLAGLKFASMGGPIAVAMGGLGGTILGLTAAAPVDSHTDAYMVVGGILLVLGFVEWALARRFARHEVVEKKDRDELVERIQKQGEDHLKLLVEDNRKALDRMLLQVESVGTRYDAIHTMLAALAKSGGERQHAIEALQTLVGKLAKDVEDLKLWRSRIGDRLGALR